MYRFFVKISYTALAASIDEFSFSQWTIGQGAQNSTTFITNNETSCTISAGVTYVAIGTIDGPDWNVTMSHGFTFDNATDTDSYQDTGNGNAHVPANHPTTGRDGAMSVQMYVTLKAEVYNDMVIQIIGKNISQDTTDQIRQEYVDHGINVQARNAFVAAAGHELNFGDYNLAILQPAQGRLADWRNEYAHAITVTSGFRNPEHNRHHLNPPGALNSQHQFGTAVDASVVDHDNPPNGRQDDSQEMINAAEAVNPAPGFTQQYSPNYTHVHVDWR